MFVKSLKEGSLVGLKTTWLLGKIIFPITLIVGILQHTPILPFFIKLITPVMNLIGLSGDAAIPLVLGNFLNLYAAIGAILTLDLTVKEVFIIAVMTSFAHNLLVESTIAYKVGVKLWIVLSVRLGLAFLSAFVINIIWQGGSEQAQYGLVQQTDEVVTGYVNIFIKAVEQAGLGVLQLAMIVIPLMIVIQFLKDLRWIDIFAKWMRPLTKLLGMKSNISTTLAAGLVFGLAFGAGVIMQAVQDDGVEKKDLTLAFIFLVSCHAVFEDTLLFVPLGIPVWPLLLIRVVTALILTFVVSYIWRYVDVNKGSRQNELREGECN